MPRVFIDEYSVQESTATNYNWATANTDDYMVGQLRSPALSIIAGIDSFGLLHLHIKEGPCNSGDFLEFLDGLRRAVHRKRDYRIQDALLFYDNAAIHKAKKVISYLEEHGMKALTNCPYALNLTHMRISY